MHIPDLMQGFAKVIMAMHGLPIIVNMGILLVVLVMIVLLYRFGIAYLDHIYPKRKSH